MAYKCKRCRRLYSKDRIHGHLCWSTRQRALLATTILGPVSAALLLFVWLHA
jgi:hypothetical protein